MTSRQSIAALLGAVVLVAGATDAHARATDGTIVRVAGTTVGFAGDGGPATGAKLDTPRDVAFLSDGSFVLADFNNDRIRKVDASGTITTIVGGSRGFDGDGGPADEAELDRPRGITALPDGGFLIADTFNDRIRRVMPDGTIQTVAGGQHGLLGDGGPATSAQLSHPSDTTPLPDGGFLIADTDDARIRRVWPDGTITTLAGTTPGFGGDGGAATSAQLNAPRDLTVATDGAVLIADTGNSRIRRVALDGTITTVVGADPGLSGDGDPATAAHVTTPFSIAALPHGGFIFADTGNHRVRRVTPLGAIFTVAGTDGGDSGDGSLAKSAQLNQPGAITLAPGGGFLVADTGNAQLRRVSDIGAVPPAVLGHSVGVEPDGGDVTVKPLGKPGYLPLQEEDLVPNFSEVDATAGHIQVALAADPSGAQITAEVFDGPFRVIQGNNARPETNFHLPPLEGCGTRRSAPAARAASAPRASIAAKKKKRKKPHRLWVREKGGKWRSSTGSTSASAVGTVWQTTLLCEGTRVDVSEGIVRVRDKIRKRTRTLHAGQSFLVKTSGARRGQ